MDRAKLSEAIETDKQKLESICSEMGKDIFMMESLILAQDERWRRGLGMQVER